MTYAFCCVREMNWNQIKVLEFSMRKMVNLPRKNNGKMDFTIQLRTNEEEEEIQKKIIVKVFAHLLSQYVYV